MVTIQDLEQSEIDAVKLYSSFLEMHKKDLHPLDIKQIKAIIKDEKEHYYINKTIEKRHK